MPSGGTRPLDITSTPARRGIEPPWAATALGSAADGTAKHDEVVARELEVGGAHDADRLRQLDAGQVLVVAAAWRRRWLACSAVRQPRSTSRPARASMTATAVPHEPAPMTAARRSGGRPPSHSHWSITHGQMRSVTAAASVRDGACTCGKVSGAADADADLVRADAPALADRLGADDGDGDDGRAGLEREPADAAARAAERAGADARALGEDQDGVAAGEDRLGGLDHVRVALAAADREGAEVVEQPAGEAAAEQLLLGDVVERPPRERGDDERVEERAVVRGEDHRAVGGDVLAPDPRQPEVEVEERLQDAADEPVDERVDALVAGAGVQATRAP